MAQAPNSKRRCIFYRDGCGRTTKEDVWPTWLAKYVPRDMQNYSTMSAVIHETHSEFIRKVVDGDPQSRRVKFVCGSCNNGWMSKLQNTAKPILLPLVTGQRVGLNLAAQKLVATWCAMSTMTADFINPEKQAIPQIHRDYLRANLSPPPDTWKIWISRYQRDKWPGRWVKNCVPVADKEHTPELNENGLPRPNTQTTTLVFGELFVHVFSTIFPSIAAPQEMYHQKIVQIWPIQEEFIAWPIASLTDKEADQLAGSIINELNRRGANA